MWIILIVTYGIFVPTLIGAGIAALCRRVRAKRRFRPWDGILPE